MEKRISVLSIVIYDRESVVQVNDILHEYSSWVVGRMGIPYEKKNVSIICLVIDAPMEVTSALAGKLGMLNGVTAKTNTAKI